MALLLTIFSACSRDNKSKSSARNKYTLVIGKLKIKSSYAGNIEQQSDSRYDTVRFWITPNAIWRVKTFSMDNDIHIISLQPNGEDSIEFAKGHINRVYGDVLDEIIILECDKDDVQTVTKKLENKKLNPKVEKGKEGVIFCNTDNAIYQTKTKPSGIEQINYHNCKI